MRTPGDYTTQRRMTEKKKLESDAICYENHMLYASLFHALHLIGVKRSIDNRRKKQIWQGRCRYTGIGWH